MEPTRAMPSREHPVLLSNQDVGGLGFRVFGVEGLGFTGGYRALILRSLRPVHYTCRTSGTAGSPASGVYGCQF